VGQATSLEELRAAQAVLLPAVMHTTLEETAALIGVGRATVPRLQASFRQSGKKSGGAVKSRNWGGRRNALMTVSEEAEFLAPWLEQAKGGGHAGGVSFAGGVGGKTRQAGEGFGAVSIAGPAWMAQGGPRHASSQK